MLYEAQQSLITVQQKDCLHPHLRKHQEKFEQAVGTRVEYALFIHDYLEG